MRTLILPFLILACGAHGAVPLPAQAPYLNTKQRYPVGNGIAMAVGEPSGDWSQLEGPGYTAPDFINNESLTLEIDGTSQRFHLEMKRAEKTGIFYGTEMVDGLKVELVDFAPGGEPVIRRLISIDNDSGRPRQIRVAATISPNRATGISSSLADDAASHPAGVTITAGERSQLPIGGKNPLVRSVVIAFSDPAASASLSGDSGLLETSAKVLAPGATLNVALCHYFHADQALSSILPMSPSESMCIDMIRKADSVAELRRSVAEWQSWFDNVPPAYRLDKITDSRARTLVEGALAILKTNESQDGGIVAHATYYKEGYVRDAVLALRGLSAMGHFDESRRWLIWIDRKYAIYKHLPDAIACEPSLADYTGIFDMGNSHVEEPGLTLVCARDYLAATHDMATLDSIRPMLRYCMNIQLKDFEANGGKLEFNGDETEICGAVNVNKAGTQMGTAAQRNDWSLSSVALCAASLDFYIHYLEANGENPCTYLNSETGATMNLKSELGKALHAMDVEFWRTDVPGIPGGFHDSFRIKQTGAWPLHRITNFTLMPVYFGAPIPAAEKAADTAAIAHYFDRKTGFLQLVPGIDDGFDGHDLGYLLWSLVEVGNPMKEEVYHALVYGPTADCWGTFNEAYTANGKRNDHDLRSLESGCNVSAIAKYWRLGTN